MPDRYLSMSVPQARVADAEKVISALGNGPGPALVGRASATGAEPATHRFLEGWHIPTLNLSMPVQMVSRIVDQAGNVTITKGAAQSVKPAEIVKALQAMQIAGVGLAAVVALLASIEVTDEGWPGHIERKNLKRIPDADLKP